MTDVHLCNHLKMIIQIETCSGMCKKKFQEELIAYFPLKRQGPHRKRRANDSSFRVFVAGGTCIPSRCLTMLGSYT
jgi:hypothetical protein